MYIKFEFYTIFHVKKYDSSPFLYNVLLCTFLVASSGELSSYQGNLLERQILDPIPDLLIQELGPCNLCLIGPPGHYGALFLKKLLPCEGI